MTPHSHLKEHALMRRAEGGQPGCQGTQPAHKVALHAELHRLATVEHVASGISMLCGHSSLKDHSTWSLLKNGCSNVCLHSQQMEAIMALQK